MRFTVLTALLLAGVPLWSQTCSNETIRGTYSVTCSGFLTPAPASPQVAASLIGTIVTDFPNGITGTAKMSVGGVIVTQVVSGTAQVNSDCTGAVSYDQKINGETAPKLNIIFHVLENGKEIRGMSVDTGATLSCNLRLMSR
jgi:hypothetical protein